MCRHAITAAIGTSPRSSRTSRSSSFGRPSLPPRRTRCRSRRASKEPQGFVAEPTPITRVALFADRHLGKGDLKNGFYVDHGKLIPGAGWASVGPGYPVVRPRHPLARRVGVDFRNGYKMAQARAELPKLPRAAWPSARSCAGRTSVTSITSASDPILPRNRAHAVRHRVHAAHRARHAAAVPLDRYRRAKSAGCPVAERRSARRTRPAEISRTFVASELSMTIDTRDFRGHPTSGTAAARRRLALRGSHQRRLHAPSATRARWRASCRWPASAWCSRCTAGSAPRRATARHVPFYLQPSLGGVEHAALVHGLSLPRPQHAAGQRRVAHRDDDARRRRRCSPMPATWPHGSHDLNLDKRSYRRRAYAFTRGGRPSRASMSRMAAKAGGSCSA